jgi:hypothetical protein
LANVTIPNVNFVPEIWAQRALQALRSYLVLGSKVTRDSDMAAFTQGATLHIPVPGTFVQNTKAANANVTLQVPTDSRIDVTLNQHKEVSFLIEDILKVQSNQDLMDRYLRNAVIPLAEGIESYLFGLYASFTTTPIGAGATPITASTLRTARKTFNDNKAAKDGRFMVVTDGDEVSILGDAALASYFAFAKSQAITDGKIGTVYGIDIYPSQLVPFSTNNKNLALTPEAIILAMRGMPDSGAPGVDQMSVSDPVSGLALRQTVSYNPNALGMQITLDVLYGASMLRDKGGFVVLS